MAAGLPVVTNPVGVHVEMVRPGRPASWQRPQANGSEAIGRSGRDPDLRRRMGAAGRKVVEEEYSVEAGAEAWRA